MTGRRAALILMGLLAGQAGAALSGTATSGAARAAAVPAVAPRAGTPLLLRDDLGRDVAFPTAPQRIVSLLPSLTETVCALGACTRLVATDRYSNWPAAVQALPKAGGLDDAQVELIVSLQPDLVLLTRSHRLDTRLRELGIRCFVIDSENYADIARSITLVGRILGLDTQARELEDRIAQGVHDVAVRRQAPGVSAAPTVYFELDRGLYAAGPASYIGQLLALLGARNIVSADLGAYPKLNPEYVVRHAPDVIFVAPAEAARLAERPGWTDLRAVREHRFCSFGPEVDDTVMRPGPRIVAGMRAMADCLERVAP